MPRRFASVSLSPIRANSRSVNMQNGTWRPVVTRLPPAMLSLTTLKSSVEICVNCGLPAQSPMAQTPSAVVCKTLVHLHIAAVGRLHARLFEADAARIGRTSCGYQQVGAFQRKVGSVARAEESDPIAGVALDAGYFC